MHHIRFRLGLRPRPTKGTYSAPQFLHLDFRGLLVKERGRVEDIGEEMERNERNLKDRKLEQGGGYF